MDIAVEYRKYRHTESHTREPKQTAADQYRYQYPEASDPYCVANDLRTDDIAVELLYHDDDDHKIECVYRVFEQQDEHRRDGADERSEERYYVCHTYYYAQHKCKRYCTDLENDECKNSDYE